MYVYRHTYYYLGASPIWDPHFFVQKCPYTPMFK